MQDGTDVDPWLWADLARLDRNGISINILGFGLLVLAEDRSLVKGEELVAWLA
jgi:hypothetical protein